MTQKVQQQLGKTLWGIADELRGSMNADDFRDYMLSFLFLKYLSDRYEEAAQKELGKEYPVLEKGDTRSPLSVWYQKNAEDTSLFEKQMSLKTHYVIQPEYLWESIASLARTQNGELLKTIERGFDFIENKSFGRSFQGLFSEINLNSDKLGRNYEERNAKLCTVISKISEGIDEFSTDIDTLGDAYEYLIAQFAAGSGKSAGEFYTPQQISSVLSGIVCLDSQDPTLGQKKKLGAVLDFACGSGSLLLNIRGRMVKSEGKYAIGKIYGQEKNITTYNLARMNMLLHGMKDTGFEIYHGDSLTNDWDILNEKNPAKKMEFEAVVANPPFSLRWTPNETAAQDFRFKSYGLAPKSAADFAFLLHGLHFLSKEGTMAIILAHGVLFRGGAEEKIRTKLLKDNYIDAVIGLPSNLFYSTGISVCVLVLKKCKKFEDVLFINAGEYFRPGKRQNYLRTGENGEPNDVDKIIDTYKFRKEDDSRYSRRVSMKEIEENGYNLNISRYVSTAVAEEKIDLKKVNKKIMELSKKIAEARKKHNGFLKELGLPPIE